jgi:hypothetical protein
MYSRFIIVKNKKYIFKIKCTKSSYYIDFQRNKFSRNVFDCSFFNRSRSKISVLWCVFEIFAMLIASFGGDNWFKLRLVYDVPADKEGEL